MSTGLEIIFLILSTAAFLIGMLGNVFIGLVNCSEWVKNQNISLADFIFTCLAISRVSQLLVLLFESLLMEQYLDLFSSHNLAKPITLLWRITNHLTTWLATCLSIFYLLKIAHFSHSLFLWLKWRMNRVILAIFVFSFIFLAFDFLLLESFNDIFLNSYIHDNNLTLYIEESKTLYFETLILLSLTCLFPIALSLTSMVLLFLSLVRHIRNLQLNSMGSRDSSTEAHKRAIKMVMSFLFLFILHFFSTQVVNWIFVMFPKHMVVKFISLLVYVFPSSHSFLLILGNSKLRQTALKVLWHLKSSLRRENLLYLCRQISQSLFKDSTLRGNFED
uniref:Taste receptor type 2 n=1 Tax=Pipistrellus kuhlii TaxID=59472 RepID=A0A7J7ZN58_PIPKU|nr:taste 2 receptor member 42 [Pipistrellus kuhlii]